MPVPENLSSLLEVPDLEVTEKNIYYSRPATVFAAVAASIFTIIGVLGECRLVLCSAPSVPQPVVQSRRMPLLGPSPD